MKTATFAFLTLTFTCLGFIAASHFDDYTSRLSDTPSSKRIAPGIAQSAPLQVAYG